MRGEVIKVDGLSGDGLISGEDGARYSFTAAASRASVSVGDRVDFVAGDGVATEIMVMGQASGAPRADRTVGQRYDAGYNFGWAMFAFDGRLRRSHFWISWAILFAVGLVTNFIPFFGLFIGLAATWCHLAIGVKRLHDMGHSGWLIAIPWVAMVLGWAAMFWSIGLSAFSDPGFFDSSDPATMMAAFGPGLMGLMVTWLIGIGFWLWIGIADSQPGRNKYGRNPKNPHEDDAEAFA